MERLKSKQFDSDIKPMLTLTQLFGTTNFSFSKNDANYSKWRCFINIIITIIYTAAAMHCTLTHLGANWNNLFYITDFLNHGTATLYVVIARLAGILCKRKRMNLILDVDNYDGNYELLFGHKADTKDTKKFVKYNLLCRSFTVVTLVTSMCLLHEKFPTKVQCTVTHIMPIVLNTVACMQISTFIYAVKVRLRSLNSEIDRLSNSSLDMGSVRHLLKKYTKIGIARFKKSTNTAQVLNQICAMHHSLCAQIERINETFGFVVLVMYVMGFMKTVIVVHHACTFEFGTWRRSVRRLMLVLILEVDCVFVSYICNATIEEVNKTGILIHKIETDDQELRDEIEMFSLQIANERVEFNAAGFFPINYALLFSIIGGVTTYIVILIQLSNR